MLVDYYERIDNLFNSLETSLETLDEDLDIQSAEGVMNVTFTNGAVFVFSRQPPTQQLWLATPGGGFHFFWNHDLQAWLDTRTSETFQCVLDRELREFSGLTF